MRTLPQEIEIWYLIPALRREFARIFVKEYHLKQKEVSKILDITEASISHYINSQRGKKIKFSSEETNKIKDSAKKIVEKNSSLTKELYLLCNFFRKTKSLCKIHKSMDKKVSKDCKICFEI